MLNRSETTDHIEVQIEHFVQQKFSLARKRHVKKTDSLLDSGIIDSMGVLEVVGFLEQQFSIRVSDEELTPENFHSIDSIAKFVRRNLHVQARPV